jgi:hypothetical protein
MTSEGRHSVCNNKRKKSVRRKEKSRKRKNVRCKMRSLELRAGVISSYVTNFLTEVYNGKRGQAPLRLEYWNNGMMEEWKNGYRDSYEL